MRDILLKKAARQRARRQRWVQWFTQRFKRKIPRSSYWDE